MGSKIFNFKYSKLVTAIHSKLKNGSNLQPAIIRKEWWRKNSIKFYLKLSNISIRILLFPRSGCKMWRKKGRKERNNSKRFRKKWQLKGKLSRLRKVLLKRRKKHKSLKIQLERGMTIHPHLLKKRRTRRVFSKIYLEWRKMNPRKKNPRKRSQKKRKKYKKLRWKLQLPVPKAVPRERDSLITSSGPIQTKRNKQKSRQSSNQQI